MNNITQFEEFLMNISQRCIAQNIIDIQHPIKSFKDVLDYIILHDAQSNQIHEFWNQDYNRDPLSEIQIKLATQINLEKFRAIKILENVADDLKYQIVFPVIIASGNVQAQSLAQAYSIQLQIQQNLFIPQQYKQQLINSHRIMTDMITGLFSNNAQINQAMNTQLQSINLIQKEPSRNHITIGNAMRWAGIADIDFIKASVIFIIIDSIMSQQIDEFTQQNGAWLIIYIASIMQEYEAQNRQIQLKFQAGTHYFVTAQIDYINDFEKDFTIRNDILQLDQENILTSNKQQIQIRPAFSKLFNITRRTDNNFIEIQGQDMQLSDSQRQLQNYLMDFAVNGSWNTDIVVRQYNQVARCLQGSLMQNISIIIYNRLKDYQKVIKQQLSKEIMQAPDISDCIVICAAVFQVPIIQSQDRDNFAITTVMDRINREYIDLIQNRSNENINMLNDQQVIRIQGWSKYYTISFQIKVSQSWQQLLELTKDTINQQVRFAIASRLVQIIDNYNTDVTQHDEAFMIANGFVFSQLNKIMIRPIIKLTRNVQIEKQAKDILNINTSQQNNNTNYLKPFNKRNQRTRKLPDRYRDDYEAFPMKKPGPKALFTEVDIKMEIAYNDLDQAEFDKNCCRRVAIQLAKLSQTFREHIEAISEITDFKHLFEFISKLEIIDEKQYVIPIKYNTQMLHYTEIISKIYEFIHIQYQQIILFISDTHVFCASKGCFIKQIKPIPESIFISKSKSAEQLTIQNVCYSKEKVAQLSKYYLNRVRKFAYFDFETTYNDIDDNFFVHKGVKQHDNLQSFEQVEFAYSLVFNIKIPFNKIIRELAREYNIEIDAIKSQDLVQTIRDRQQRYQKSHFGLRCGIDLVQELQQKQIEIQKYIELYNIDLQYILEQSQLKLLSIIDQIRISSDLQIYSYNGSKFDNHFILSAIKDIEGQKWYQHVSYIGTQQDMKIMQYKGLNFIDIKLMTGGQSLKQFCKDLNIQNEMSKIDIDMNKMKTFSIAKTNQDEILKYVMNDSFAIYEIHKQFEKAIRQIIIDFNRSQEKFSDHTYSLSPNLEYQESFTNLDHYEIQFKCLKGMFTNWYTISSLSMTIFKLFFLPNNIQSNPNTNIYEFMQNSYQGGYTQAFVIGDVGQKAFYYDYNSMYPAIMSNAKVPVNLNQCELIEFEQQIQFNCDNTDNIKQQLGIHFSIDPLQISKSDMYQLQICYGHYDLIELSQFEFHESCFVPSFGMRTKNHGTLYVKQFDYAQCQEQLLAPIIVFGFQIVQAVRHMQLKSFSVKKQLKFKREQFNPKYIKGAEIQPIFRDFDQYMYEARLSYKKQKNSTMAQCVKLFINSLYGKFGEKHHNIQFNIDENDINDEQMFKNTIQQHINKHKGVNTDLSATKDITDYQIKIMPMFDLNDRDSHTSRIVIDDVPMLNNHIGSFVYYASMITAIGRTQIIQIAQQINILGGQVFYIDTDSIITDKYGSQLLKQGHIAKIDPLILGCLKNEYPADNDCDDTQIQQLIVFNKKIYQYKINDVWTNKFKGCRNASDDMSHAFTNGSCKYTCKQTRFKKDNANVTIIDMQMQYKLRLSRKVCSNGKFVKTMPYNQLQDLRQDYKDVDAHIVFDQQLERWVIKI